MNIDDYNNLKIYLETSQLPEGLSLMEIKSFKKQATHFIVQHNRLYRRNKRNPQEPLRVIREYELLDILFNLYKHLLVRYFEIEGIYNKSKNKYY